MRWLWFGIAAALYAIILLWYLYARATQPFVGPFRDPLRFFGIVAFLLILITTAYTLRRRFVRGLPGMARDWLELHIWFGIAALLIVFLHENFGFLFGASVNNLFEEDWGPLATLSMVLLVFTGIAGRLLDMWEARAIAREASTNGVGIVQAVEERMLELEYVVERLSAGKSDAFKQYCLAVLDSATLPTALPMLNPKEEQDFLRATTTLKEYVMLAQSLQKQKRAKRIMRVWRYTHMVIAILALLVICYHSIVELLTSVLHV